MDKKIKLFMKKLKETPDFDRVKFVILFGSRTEERARKDSDYDFAVYYEGDRDKKFRFLLNANFDKNFDVKIFQDLPLFIQKDVLRGKIFYAKDVSFVHDVAYETIKKFEHFKKYYEDYIKTRKLRLKR